MLNITGKANKIVAIKFFFQAKNVQWEDDFQ